MKLKRTLAALLALLMMISAAMADTITHNAYTDVPTAMTQDSVARAVVSQDCTMELLQPDERSIALLDRLYTFVYDRGNRPVRYYDVETQNKIQTLIGGVDPDILHMTEAMRIQLAGQPEKAVTADMYINVEYQPGQLVVVVLGVPQGDDGYTWYPYRANVPQTGLIEWEIPVDEWNAMKDQPISLHVLTNRITVRGGEIWDTATFMLVTPAYSKDSRDLINILNWHTEWGEPIEDNFRVYIVDLTTAMQAEVARIGEHVAQGLPLLDYFPEERKAEALLMLPDDVDLANLIAYDIIALKDEYYKDTYGDVSVEITFGTTYDAEKAMVILAGFEIKNAQAQPYIEWYVLRTEALASQKGESLTDLVEIGLKQLNLTRMDQEPLMLVVISEALTD